MSPNNTGEGGGDRGGGLTYTYRFLSIFEVNFISKILEKAMFSVKKIVTSHWGAGLMVGATVRDNVTECHMGGEGGGLKSL